ncbi:hypothetical protein [Cellulomonas sp.]|uniref:hypothetical protein n=1 Tax=Cellulomonas sp. TaxID=40001 RepID=UPI003BAA0714
MTRRFPLATVLGWTALVLAAVAAVAVALAVVQFVEGARDPQSWGALGGVVLLMYSLVPAVVALPVGIVQARRGSGPRWRTRWTTVLGAVAPVAVGILVVTVVIGNLVG